MPSLVFRLTPLDPPVREEPPSIPNRSAMSDKLPSSQAVLLASTLRFSFMSTASLRSHQLPVSVELRHGQAHHKVVTRLLCACTIQRSIMETQKYIKSQCHVPKNMRVPRIKEETAVFKRKTTVNLLLFQLVQSVCESRLFQR